MANKTKNPDQKEPGLSIPRGVRRGLSRFLRKGIIVIWWPYRVIAYRSYLLLIFRSASFDCFFVVASVTEQDKLAHIREVSSDFSLFFFFWVKPSEFLQLKKYFFFQKHQHCNQVISLVKPPRRNWQINLISSDMKKWFICLYVYVLYCYKEKNIRFHFFLLRYVPIVITIIVQYWFFYIKALS
jgi:hypothetical protein